MKTSGLVLVVALGCGQSSTPLPVEEPKPLAESKLVPTPDASVIDAGPSPEALAAAERQKAESAQAERAKAIEEAHDECMRQAEALDPMPLPSKPAKGASTAAVVLLGVGGQNEREHPHGLLHPAWKGDPIAKKLRPRLAPITKCYADALKRNPDARGGISLGAEIEETGTFEKVRAISDRAGDPQLTACITDAFGKLKVPGGSKDAYGFEAYFDLVLCPSNRTVCMLDFAADDDIRDQLLVEARAQEAILGACFKKAGTSHVRGDIDSQIMISKNGGIRGGGHPVNVFAGDDKKGTAEEAATECMTDAWSHFCLDPPPIDGERNFHVRMWFQR